MWTAIAAEKAGKWYRGVLEAAERFMVKWHENEATMSRNCHASATGGAAMHPLRVVPKGIGRGG